MLIYYAEPVDFRRDHAWSTNLSGSHTVMEVAFRQHTVFKPAKAWSLGTDSMSDALEPSHVFDINRVALDRSDLVVAFLPPDQVSIGVPTEIGWATDQGKPVVLVTDPDTAARSLMIKGNPRIIVATTPEQTHQAVSAAIDLAQANRIASGLTGAQRVLPYLGTDTTRMGERHYAGDAAFDLFTTEDTVIHPGDYRMIPCGVRIEFPDDVFGWIVARSSTMRDWGLHVIPGIIDSGFRGEMAVSALRIPDWGGGSIQSALFNIPAGTRLAQLVLLPNVTRQFAPRAVEEINQGDRGMNGWGSTTKVK